MAGNYIHTSSPSTSQSKCYMGFDVRVMVAVPSDFIKNENVDSFNSMPQKKKMIKSRCNNNKQIYTNKYINSNTLYSNNNRCAKERYGRKKSTHYNYTQPTNFKFHVKKRSFKKLMYNRHHSKTYKRRKYYMNIKRNRAASPIKRYLFKQNGHHNKKLKNISKQKFCRVWKPKVIK